MMNDGYDSQLEAEEEKEPQEQLQFFDARDDISSYNSCPGSPSAQLHPGSTSDLHDWDSEDPHFVIWIGKLESVQERRQRFVSLMKLTCQDSEDLGIATLDDMLDEETIMSRISVHRTSTSQNEASLTSWSSGSDAIRSTSEDELCEENFQCRIKNLDDGTEFVVDQLGEDGMLSRLREVGSNRTVTIDEFHHSLGASSFVQHLMRRQDNMSTNSVERVRKRRLGWLRRLGAVACIVNRQEVDLVDTTSEADQSLRAVHRIKVRPYRKHSKHFSAVYLDQDIQAHSGAILTMKFSPDGQYLATGGQDGVVRVWDVTTCKRTYKNDVPKDDPSCIYFTLDHHCAPTPVLIKEETKSKSRGMKTTADSACIIIPAEVFQISKKPLHEFHGHTGDVLDLSWSHENYLLSSSTDKTTCLWQLGCDNFMEVFLHSNYVTCVQFNPIDENYFVSGSIDGKVRIWDISGHRVVDWIDAKEIVTAVCYSPDGKGIVVGTIMGHCLFYNSSDNHMRLDSDVLLQGKRKSVCCKITGFQFCPGDPQKLMITCADSQVRILDGVNVVCKYKGLWNSGSQISASFSADGKYIISASEDSNVYIWNNDEQVESRADHVRKIWSHERFLSENVSVAISWQRMDSASAGPVKSQVLASHKEGLEDLVGTTTKDLCCHSESSGNGSCLPSSGGFGLGQSFLSEFLPRGSATWPEEKLPSSSMAPSTAFCKSQYKLLKTSCQNVATSPHAWGRVIVTAGWDGRIRSFHNYGLPVLT